MVQSFVFCLGFSYQQQFWFIFFRTDGGQDEFVDKFDIYGLWARIWQDLDTFYFVNPEKYLRIN